MPSDQLKKESAKKNQTLKEPLRNREDNTMQVTNANKKTTLKSGNILNCIKTILCMQPHPVFPNFLSVASDDTITVELINPVATKAGQIDLTKSTDIYVPQLMSALKFAHSREIILTHVNKDTIFISGDRALFMDFPDPSVGQRKNFRTNLTVFNAPETHLHHQVVKKSDYYGLGLWWYSTCNAIEVEDPIALQDIAYKWAKVNSPAMSKLLEFKHHYRKSEFPDVVVSMSELQHCIQDAFSNGKIKELSEAVTDENLNVMRSILHPLLYSVDLCTKIRSKKLVDRECHFSLYIIPFATKIITVDRDVAKYFCKSTPVELSNIFLMGVLYNLDIMPVARYLIEKKFFVVTEAFILELLKTDFSLEHVHELSGHLEPGKFKEMLSLVFSKSNHTKFNDLVEALQSINTRYVFIFLSVLAHTLIHGIGRFLST